MTALRVCLLVVLAWASIASCRAADPDGASVEPLWQLVAASPIIVVGTLHVPTARIEERRAAGKPDYVDLDITAAEVLRGGVPESFAVKWFTKDSSFGPTFGSLSALNGRSVIAFLVRIREGEIYFAGGSAGALLAADEREVQQVRAEIEAQHQWSARFPAGLPSVPQWQHDVVRRLMDDTTMRGKADGAFEHLLRLDRNAVPALITLMNDRRDVAAEWLRIPNPPGHWESYASYKPEKVVDAIDGILTKITGLVFVCLVNGASDDNRQATVDAWRVYLYHLQKDAVVKR